MADELTIDATLQYADSDGTAFSLQINALLASVASHKISPGKLLVPTSQTAIPLDQATAPHWAIFINRDATNFITLYTASAGQRFAKLLPGEFAMLPLGPDAQAPYALADTASCFLEYFIANSV